MVIILKGMDGYCMAPKHVFITCTVIFVVMAGSIMAASSCAAKILSGLFAKSMTEMNLWSQIRWRRLRAKSRSSARPMLYLKDKTEGLKIQ